MRSKFDIYNIHLEAQAEMSFGVELTLFYVDDWLNSNSIIDFGCGNGSYLRRLAKQFPEKKFLGIDINQESINEALAVGMPENVELRCCSLIEVTEKFDCMVSRLCIMYIKDKVEIVNWVKENVRNLCIEIESADHHFRMEPELPEFRSLFQKMEQFASKSGGTRDIVKEMRPIWRDAGIECEQTREVVVTSEPPFSRCKMYQLMLLNVELISGDSISYEMHQEIFNWYIEKNGYVQYGLQALYLSLK